MARDWKCPVCGRSGATRLDFNAIGSAQRPVRFEIAALNHDNLEAVEVEEPAFRPGLDELMLVAAYAVPAFAVGWGVADGIVAAFPAGSPYAGLLRWSLAGLAGLGFAVWRTLEFDEVRMTYIHAAFFERETERENAGVMVQNPQSPGTTRRLQVARNQLERFAVEYPAKGSTSYANWIPKRNGFTRGQFDAFRQLLLDYGWAVQTNGELTITPAGEAELGRWRAGNIGDRVVELWHEAR